MSWSIILHLTDEQADDIEDLLESDEADELPPVVLVVLKDIDFWKEKDESSKN